MLYAAKCYWPGITAREFERGAAGRLAETRRRGSADAAYRGSIVFVEDQLLLCLFEGGSTAAVRHSADRAHVPCERVMPLVWLPASGCCTPRLYPTVNQDGGRKP
jgi:hypothetical protein